METCYNKFVSYDTKKRVCELKANKADKLAAILSKTFLFQGISSESILPLIENPMTEIIQFQKGDTVYDRLHYRKSIGLVIKGSVIVEKDYREGRKVIMNTLHEGEIFGGAAVFHDENAFIGTITAREKCEVFFMSQPLLLELFEKDIQIAVNYISFLSKSLLFLNRRIDGFAQGDTEEKVIQFLLNNGNGIGAFSEVELEYSYTKLSEFLNIGRASLYRTLDELEKNGLLKREGRKITILNRELLQKRIDL